MPGDLVQIRVGEPLLRGFEECAHRLRKGTFEEGVQQVPQRGALGVLEGILRGIEVALAIAPVAQMTLPFQNRHRVTDGVVPGLVRHQLHDLGDARLSEVVDGIHDLALSSAEVQVHRVAQPELRRCAVHVEESCSWKRSSSGMSCSKS